MPQLDSHACFSEKKRGYFVFPCEFSVKMVVRQMLSVLLPFTTVRQPYFFPDIDECAVDPSKCSTEHEKCVNTVGSYSCECVDGYKRENNKCIIDFEGNI